MSLLTRNDYQIRISVYEKRRKKYQEMAKRLTYRIGVWRESMKRIGSRKCDISDEKCKMLGKMVMEFMNVDLKNIGSLHSREQILAKQLFCKYGLERGLSGARLAKFMGMVRAMPARLRSQFPSSQRELYRRFCNYIQENEEENQQLNRVTEEHPSEG